VLDFRLLVISHLLQVLERTRQRRENSQLGNVIVTIIITVIITVSSSSSRDSWQQRVV